MYFLNAGGLIARDDDLDSTPTARFSTIVTTYQYRLHASFPGNIDRR
jgi:hypothetical protein